MTLIPKEIYLQEDVVNLSRWLLGKHLFTRINGIVCGGIISETEAYKGPEDKASHAYNMRKTTRNEVMYAEGGIAYVFICYGLHHLFNIVTNQAGIPHAILIRSLLPTHGIDHMEIRRKNKKPLTEGPGNLSQALGITKQLNGDSLSFSPQDPFLQVGDIRRKIRAQLKKESFDFQYIFVSLPMEHRHKIRQNNLATKTALSNNIALIQGILDANV